MAITFFAIVNHKNVYTLVLPPVVKRLVKSFKIPVGVLKLYYQDTFFEVMLHESNDHYFLSEGWERVVDYLNLTSMGIVLFNFDEKWTRFSFSFIHANRKYSLGNTFFHFMEKKIPKGVKIPRNFIKRFFSDSPPKNSVPVQIANVSKEFHLLIKKDHDRDIFFFSTGWTDLVYDLELPFPLLFFFRLDNEMMFHLNVYKMNGEEFIIPNPPSKCVKDEEVDDDFMSFFDTPTGFTKTYGACTSSSHVVTKSITPSSSSKKPGTGTFEINCSDPNIYWFKQILQNRVHLSKHFLEFSGLKVGDLIKVSYEQYSPLHLMVTTEKNGIYKRPVLHEWRSFMRLYGLSRGVPSRLPPKSIGRFKQLSKYCCFVLSSENFTIRHCRQMANSSNNYILAVKEEKCIIGKLSRSTHLPWSTTNVSLPLDITSHDFLILANLHGLLVVSNLKTSELVLWNPTTKENKVISNIETNGYYIHQSDAVGFYMDSTKDYRVLHIQRKDERIHVYTYSRRLGFWRRLYCTINKDYHKNSFVWSPGVFCNDKVYFAVEEFWVGGKNRVIFFDVNNEIFTEMPFPENIDGVICRGNLVSVKNQLQMFISYTYPQKSVDLWELVHNNWKKVSVLTDIFHLPLC
ncbi:hypothetical protein QVD17_20227 [Tagetes erecta]|uniref:F-box associated beta-propeller type 1 domain-containing protein n=1 Tax=Tagetes erecta TaxID=13708 RepID=A0AAD8KPJ5_TARER|nr:hypothetical protein QVD17_20227 [Tagetes erecta]